MRLSIQEKFAQQNLLSARPLPENEGLMVNIITSSTPSASVESWRAFFLTDFSKPILQYVAKEIFKKPWSYVPYIQGEYVIFISATGGDEQKPYYKVSLFKRQRNSMLRTYISTITVRYFLDEKMREDRKAFATERIEDKTNTKINFSGSEVVENAWFALLIYEGETNALSANDLKLMERLKEEINNLPPEEKMVIEMTYFEHCKGDEIYDELLLNNLISPECNVKDLAAKSKQTEVSKLRKKALKHLKDKLSDFKP